MPNIRSSGRSRGARSPRRRRPGRGDTKTTPQFLRYRWYAVVRSRRGTQAVFLFIVVSVIVAFALLRRVATRQPEQPLDFNLGSPPPP
jgi:hypothetical protein